MRCGIVLTILVAMFSSDPAMADDQLVDEQYRTACGPIAVYTALRSINFDLALSDTVKACNWKEGERTQFSVLAKALTHYGADVKAVRVSPEQLVEWLGRREGVAILPVRKSDSQADHCVCVTSNSEGGIRAVDYPEISYNLHPNMLTDIWNGEALLVTRRYLPLGEVLTLGVLPGLLAGIGISAAWYCLRRRRELTP
jgi:hypothetical protein